MSIKTKSKEWKSPTEEETDVVCKLAFEAAKTSLSGILDKALEEASNADLVREILQSLLAVHKVVEKQNLAFERDNPDFNTHSYYLDESLIVANALLSEIENNGELRALSYGGYMIIAFSRAIAIQSKMSDIETLSDEGEYFGSKSAVTKSLRVLLED